MNTSTTKPVRAAQVQARSQVTVLLDRNTGEALTYARQYIVDLPRLTAEVVRAGAAVTGKGY